MTYMAEFVALLKKHRIEYIEKYHWLESAVPYSDSATFNCSPNVERPGYCQDVPSGQISGQAI